MSRYAEGDYDEDYNNAWALSAANARRALKGKRGRKVLTELRDALKALPQPRLVEGAMCTVNADERVKYVAEVYGSSPSEWAQHIAETSKAAFREEVARQGEGVCAIGAYLWHRNVKAGMTPEEAFAALPTQDSTNGDSTLEDTAAVAKREAGVVYSLAWELAYRNDETFGSKTPEERHAAFLAWIDSELADAS